MDCVAWIGEQINQNLLHVDANERWYENLETAAITNMSASESCQHIPEVSSTDLQPVAQLVVPLGPPGATKNFLQKDKKFRYSKS